MESFDYTAAIARVCEDICFRVPELRHIIMNRVAVSFSRTKTSEPFGIFATTTPLRFENGETIWKNKGRSLTVQHCFGPDGTEFLYIICFYVPRFIELSLLQKLETIIHELYHIGPRFDGDLRRFAGRCFAHGSSKKRYDQIVSKFVHYWLKQDPPEEIWGFLRYNYRELTVKYGKLFGTQIPIPQIIPVIDKEE